MSVWYAIPSARQDGGTIPAWSQAGYKVAVFVDPGSTTQADLILTGEYPGYANAVNAMCKEILTRWPDTEWIVTGGDDITPDPRNPDEIAAECTEHFGGTFGIMQPTGDRWAGGSIDRICGSPWMGAEWCRRMYGGNGPLWHGWRHMWVDEELQNVAQGLGVLWQRPDLTHEHFHWHRTGEPEPEHLKDKNLTYNSDKPLFQQRMRDGFPGHEPIQCEQLNY